MPPEGDTATGTGSPTEGSTQQGTGTDATPWTTGLDAETVGYFQNRGWADKTPAEVAVLASKAHREAEKFIGAPADQILRLPKATDGADAWKPVYERLGKPADAKEYDFSTVKVGDQPLAAADQDFYRGVADKLNLSKTAAVELAQAIVERTGTQAASAAAERQAETVKQFEGLKQSWGANLEANTFIANQAAAKLGLDAEILTTLRDVAGGAKVAQALLTLGIKMGEDKFVSNANPAAPGVFTIEQATAQLAALKRDEQWTTRLLNGDVDAVKTFNALSGVIASAE